MLAVLQNTIQINFRNYQISKLNENVTELILIGNRMQKC